MGMCACNWPRPYPAPRRSVIVRTADSNVETVTPRKNRFRIHQLISPPIRQTSAALDDTWRHDDGGDRSSSPWLQQPYRMSAASSSSSSSKDDTIADPNVHTSVCDITQHTSEDATCEMKTMSEQNLPVQHLYHHLVQRSFHDKNFLQVPNVDSSSTSEHVANVKTTLIPATTTSISGGVIQVVNCSNRNRTIMYDTAPPPPLPSEVEVDMSHAELYECLQTTSCRVAQTDCDHPGSIMDIGHHHVTPSKPMSHSAADDESNLLADADGDLPLHIAVAKEDESWVAQLIHSMVTSNISLNVHNNLMQTPLHVAVMTAHTRILRRLLNAGASCTVPDRNGNTAVHLAVRSSTMECINILLENPMSVRTLHQHNYNGYTPLHLAVFRQDTDLIGLLMSRGGDCNVIDGTSGRTPLFHAVLNGCDNVVRKLINLGANVNMPNYAGITPLVIATDRRLKNITSLLISKGATINARDE